VFFSPDLIHDGAVPVEGVPPPGFFHFAFFSGDWSVSVLHPGEYLKGWKKGLAKPVPFIGAFHGV